MNFLKWFFIISIVSVIVFRFIPIPVTPMIIYNVFVQAFDSDRDFRLKKDWVSQSNISDKMRIAVVASEDQLFYSHSGFDFEAIKKAFQYNEKHKKTKGGSTISQQTAKNVFCLPHRNYFRKGLEAYFTILIELFWSKDRILEVYLNVIEYGNGIYGVEAASQHFFKKSAQNLTGDEAALLAAVLPNPIIYRVDKPTSYVLKRKNLTKRQMRNFGSFEELKQLKKEPKKKEIEQIEKEIETEKDTEVESELKNDIEKDKENEPIKEAETTQDVQGE